MSQDQITLTEQVLHELRLYALGQISKIPPQKLLDKIHQIEREIKGPPKPPEGRGNLIIVAKRHFYHHMKDVESVMRNQLTAAHYEIIDLSKVNNGKGI